MVPIIAERYRHSFVCLDVVFGCNFCSEKNILSGGLNTPNTLCLWLGATSPVYVCGFEPLPRLCLGFLVYVCCSNPHLCLWFGTPPSPCMSGLAACIIFTLCVHSPNQRDLLHKADLFLLFLKPSTITESETGKTFVCVVQ